MTTGPVSLMLISCYYKYEKLLIQVGLIILDMGLRKAEAQFRLEVYCAVNSSCAVGVQSITQVGNELIYMNSTYVHSCDYKNDISV